MIFEWSVENFWFLKGPPSLFWLITSIDDLSKMLSVHSVGFFSVWWFWSNHNGTERRISIDRPEPGNFCSHSVFYLLSCWISFLLSGNSLKLIFWNLSSYFVWIMWMRNTWNFGGKSVKCFKLQMNDEYERGIQRK